MDVSKTRRLKELELANWLLKGTVAELTLDIVLRNAPGAAPNRKTHSSQ